MKYLLTSVTLLSLSVFAGCGGDKSTTITPSIKVEPPQVEQQLIMAAGSIDASLRELAHTKKTHTLPGLNTAPLITPEGGMGGLIDINWIGPVVPLVKKLADTSGYKIKVLGKEPAIPAVVSISQKNIMVADVLKDAMLQLGRKATIMVYPTNRIIELRYHN